jgi:hypothetical protein
MNDEKRFTVVGAMGQTPQPQIVETGLTTSQAAECMLSLENGSHKRFLGEKAITILVREDCGTEYLPTNQFFEHRY